MTRTGKAFSWVGGILLLLVAALAIFIMTFDWNRLKPTLNDKVSAELQRRFEIRGDLGVDWTRNKDEGGWRAWVPWPHIHAEDVWLGNPPNIPGDGMATLKRVDASIAPLALLGKEVLIPRIWLKQPQASLQRLANGDNNWTFNLANGQDASQPPSAWSVNIHDIVFDRGQITFKDATLKADFRATVDPLGKPLPFSEVTGKRDANRAATPDYAFGWQVKAGTTASRWSAAARLAACCRCRTPICLSRCRPTCVPAPPGWRWPAPCPIR